MRPDRCLRNVGSKARVSDITPNTLVSMTRRTSASGMSSKAPPAATPALCTTPSRKPPVMASVSATPLLIEAASVTSSCTMSTLRAAPDWASAASRAPRRSRLRIDAMTRQPRFAISTVARRPNPADVPVIRTVRIRAPFFLPCVPPRAPRVRRSVRYSGLYICCRRRLRMPATIERAAPWRSRSPPGCGRPLQCLELRRRRS